MGVDCFRVFVCVYLLLCLKILFVFLSFYFAICTQSQSGPRSGHFCFVVISLLWEKHLNKSNLRGKGFILAQSQRKTAIMVGDDMAAGTRNLLFTLHPHSGSRGWRGSKASIQSLKPAPTPEWSKCSSKVLPPRGSWPWTVPPTGNQVFKHTGLSTELTFKAQQPFSLLLLSHHALCRTGRDRATGQAQRLH